MSNIFVTRIGVLPILFAFLLLPSSVRTQTAAPTTRQVEEVSSESYAVYSALVTQRYSRWFKAGTTVRISAVTKFRFTSSYEEAAANCRQRLSVEKPLFDELVSANASKRRIRPMLSLPGHYSLVTEATQISNRHEPGMVWFSVVGFSSDRLHAMVFVSNYCGDLCGSGLLWTLDKKGDQWAVATEHPICGYVS